MVEGYKHFQGAYASSSTLMGKKKLHSLKHADNLPPNHVAFYQSPS